MSILAAFEGLPEGDDLRMFEKLARSAGLGPGAVKLADSKDKAALWRAIRSSKPAVILAFGLGPARMLAAGKSSYRLEGNVGRPFRPAWLDPPAVVVPTYTPAYLLRHGKKEIAQAVALLRRAKAYAEENG